MNSSWKTSLFGILAGIGGGIAAAYALKPELFAGFPKWLPGLGLLISAIASSCLGMAARDNNKSSEQVGAGGQGSVPISVKVPLFFLLGALSFFFVPGCASPPQRVAYDVAAAPAMTVDHAMQAWGDYVHQFHPPASQELQVKALFDRAKAAEIVAIDAAKALADLESSGSTNSISARAQNTLTSQSAQNALADLVNLLRSFGVKI